MLEILLIIPAGLLGLLLERKIKRRGVLFLLAIPAAIAFDVIVQVLPFNGVVDEAGVCVGGVIALGVVFSLVFHLSELSRPPTRGVDLLAGLVILLLAISIAVPWTARGRYAAELRWACDGRIIEMYHSHNHGMLSLLIGNDRGGEMRMEGVATVVFNQARVGDHLKKVAGERDGVLNGQPVRIVAERWGKE